MLYWFSWLEYNKDCSPLRYPPNEKVLAFWCTGSGECERGKYQTMTAYVVGGSPRDCVDSIEKDWPQFGAFTVRFCERVVQSWLELILENHGEGSRFPLGDWDKKRVEEYIDRQSKGE